MNPFALAVWAYWWRAAPWARGGHLATHFPDMGIPNSNGINDLHKRKGGLHHGPDEALKGWNPTVLKLSNSAELADVRNRTSGAADA